MTVPLYILFNRNILLFLPSMILSLFNWQKHSVLCFKFQTTRSRVNSRFLKTFRGPYRLVRARLNIIEPTPYIHLKFVNLLKNNKQWQADTCLSKQGQVGAGGASLNLHNTAIVFLLPLCFVHYLCKWNKFCESLRCPT